MAHRPTPTVRPLEAIAVWRRYFHAALNASAAHARHVIDYDGLLDAPGPELERLLGWLGQQIPDWKPAPGIDAAVESLLRPELRHHRADEGYATPDDVAAHAALLAGGATGGAAARTCYDPDRLMLDRDDLRWEVSRLSGELHERGARENDLRSLLNRSVAELVAERARTAATERRCREQQAVRQRAELEVRELKDSWSYRVGRIVVAPASWVKRRLQDPAPPPSSGAAPPPQQLAPPLFSVIIADEEAEGLASLEQQTCGAWERDGDRAEWIVLIRPGYRLHHNALAEVADRLEREPGVDLLYTDEDRIDESGAHHDPLFKPQFSPELLLSRDYLGGLLVVRRETLEQSGGMRAGAGWFDLVLRVSERARLVRHIPLVLSHAGPARCADHRWPATSRQALEAAVARRGLDATLRRGGRPQTYRVQHAVDPEAPVTIVVPTRDRVDLLQRCVTSIRNHTRHRAYEILVICNSCEERATFEYLDAASARGELRFVRHDVPFNFSELNNFAVKEQTEAPYLLFLNNDVEVLADGWLTAMLEHAQQERIGAVGARLLYRDGTIQHAGIVLGIMGGAGHAMRGQPLDHPDPLARADVVRNCSAVTAACLLTRRELFLASGGFDESFGVAFNDVDLCLRLSGQGYRIVYTPYASLFHAESSSRGRDDSPAAFERYRRELKRMLDRWGDRMLVDPYYNPNLAEWREDFSVATEADRERTAAFRRAMAESSV